jgi:hypothetical protein
MLIPYTPVCLHLLTRAHMHAFTHACVHTFALPCPRSIHLSPSKSLPPPFQLSSFSTNRATDPIAPTPTPTPIHRAQLLSLPAQPSLTILSTPYSSRTRTAQEMVWGRVGVPLLVLHHGVGCSLFAKVAKAKGTAWVRCQPSPLACLGCPSLPLQRSTCAMACWSASRRVAYARRRRPASNRCAAIKSTRTAGAHRARAATAEVLGKMLVTVIVRGRGACQAARARK